MPQLEPAADKPQRILINYTPIRAAELKALYTGIARRHQVERTTVLERYVRREKTEDDPEAHVENCLKFLRTIDMISTNGETIRVINEDVFNGFSFELKLLAHIRQQPYPQDHLWNIYGVALSEGARTLSLDELETLVKRELDDYDFAWNTTKLRMWQALMEQLGVISVTKEEGIILSPCRALLYELLAIHEHRKSDDVTETFEWINEEFLQVFERGVGTRELHPAISDVLQNIEADGYVSLRSMTDAQEELKLPKSTHSIDTRRVKSYSIDDVPEGKAAYRYPLDQELEVQE